MKPRDFLILIGIFAAPGIAIVVYCLAGIGYARILYPDKSKVEIPRSTRNASSWWEGLSDKERSKIIERQIKVGDEYTRKLIEGKRQ